MDRYFLVGLLIVTAISALIIIDVVLLPQLSSPDSSTNHYDSISNNPAVNIALSDPGTKATINSYHGNYKIDGALLQAENSKSGFVNVTDTLVAVTMSLQGGMYAPDHYLIFVDLNLSKVVGSEWYAYRDTPASMDIALPPSACYYHKLNGGIEASPGRDYGIQTFWGSLDNLSPENATIYPFLMDEANLSLMKNGSSYEPALYIDTFTHQPAILNGSSPVGPGWIINASIQRTPLSNSTVIPNFDFSQNYYIVFENAGPDTIRMTIGM